MIVVLSMKHSADEDIFLAEKGHTLLSSSSSSSSSSSPSSEPIESNNANIEMIFLFGIMMRQIFVLKVNDREDLESDY